MNKLELSKHWPAVMLSYLALMAVNAGIPRFSGKEGMTRAEPFYWWNPSRSQSRSFSKSAQSVFPLRTSHRCPFWLVCLKHRGPWFRWGLFHLPGPPSFPTDHLWNQFVAHSVHGCRMMSLGAMAKLGPAFPNGSGSVNETYMRRGCLGSVGFFFWRAPSILTQR